MDFRAGPNFDKLVFGSFKCFFGFFIPNNVSVQIFKKKKTEQDYKLLKKI